LSQDVHIAVQYCEKHAWQPDTLRKVSRRGNDWREEARTIKPAQEIEALAAEIAKRLWSAPLANTRDPVSDRSGTHIDLGCGDVLKRGEG
jgi:hypothetical protein